MVFCLSLLHVCVVLFLWWVLQALEDMGGLEETVFNERAIKRNTAIVDYCRTSGAVIAGATAGVLGLTGLYGFAFYFLYSLLLSVMLAVKAGRNSTNFFQSSYSVWFSGVLGGLFTYVLLWTFLYGMVHVY